MKSKHLLIAVAGVFLCLGYLWLNEEEKESNTKIAQTKGSVPSVSTSQPTPYPIEPVADKDKLKPQLSIEELKQSGWWATVKKKISHREYHIHLGFQAL